MSGTALDHPLVRSYLRDLDLALAALPAAQARELTEQITAHLDDALRPGSGDQEVAAVLRQLGSPADLAAEAAGPTAPGPPGTRPAVTARLRTWLRGLSFRRRAALAVVAVAAAGVAAWYCEAALTAPPVQNNGAFSWWYPQDTARAAWTEADGAEQTTVPIRSGQQQGFAITVDNPSDWTQTILGAVAYSGSPGAPTAQVVVATADPYHGGGVFQPLRYVLPGSIPPHQTRALRVMWVSTTCLEKGSAQGVDRLVLRVRVGVFTRTEVIPLDQGVYLSGPSQRGCTT